MRNYLLEEIKDNELMTEKHQKVCRVLNYISHVSGCASISAFNLLVENTAGITSSEIGLKICAITAAVKMYKLIIEKKRKKTRPHFVIKQNRYHRGSASMVYKYFIS